MIILNALLCNLANFVYWKWQTSSCFVKYFTDNEKFLSCTCSSDVFIFFVFQGSPSEPHRVDSPVRDAAYSPHNSQVSPSQIVFTGFSSSALSFLICFHTAVKNFPWVRLYRFTRSSLLSTFYRSS